MTHEVVSEEECVHTGIRTTQVLALQCHRAAGVWIFWTRECGPGVAGHQKVPKQLARLGEIFSWLPEKE